MDAGKVPVFQRCTVIVYTRTAIIQITFQIYPIIVVFSSTLIIFHNYRIYMYMYTNIFKINLHINKSRVMICHIDKQVSSCSNSILFNSGAPGSKGGVYIPM